MSKKISIFWFRRDLRLEDNAGFYYALSGDHPVLPVFIFDKHILDDLEDKTDARVTFIHRVINQMKTELEQNGSSIKVIYDTPENAFNQLLDDYDIAEVFTNRDYEPYATERDEKIHSFLKSKNVRFNDFKDQVIFEKAEITTNAGEPYKVFTPYKNAWMEKFKSMNLDQYQCSKHFSNLAKTEALELPTLQEMGFEETTVEIPPLKFKEKVISRYDELRNFPAQDGTSRLGVHLRFGTVSVREAVKRALKLNDAWLNELIWREFYMMILANFPHVVDKAFKSKYDNIPWRNNKADFEKWCAGKTGYPIVDAGMRELNTTGYMHNRVRMIVASFLTKHLLIDWRWGEAYFAKKLLDFELSSNNGGWQWAAGSGTDAQPYFRIFNPYSQTDKFDKDNTYIKKWVPEYGTNQYPEPMVDHKDARQRALDTFKEALA